MPAETDMQRERERVIEYMYDRGRRTESGLVDEFLQIVHDGVHAHGQRAATRGLDL